MIKNQYPSRGASFTSLVRTFRRVWSGKRLCVHRKSPVLTHWLDSAAVILTRAFRRKLRRVQVAQSLQETSRITAASRRLDKNNASVRHAKAPDILSLSRLVRPGAVRWELTNQQRLSREFRLIFYAKDPRRQLGNLVCTLESNACLHNVRELKLCSSLWHQQTDPRLHERKAIDRVAGVDFDGIVAPRVGFFIQIESAVRC